MRWNTVLAYAVAAALTSSVFGPGAAHADNIDEELLARAPQLIKTLKGKGYSKIGVVTFLYQHGKEPSKFRGAAICNSMPTRVENALILKLNKDQPELTLLPQAATKLANTAPKEGFRTPEARKQLLSQRLFPAWDAVTKVKADAFIFGKVQSSNDLREVTVSLGAFDAESLYDVLEFTVPIDRYVLADIGQGFSLTKSAAKAGGLKGVGTTTLRSVADDAIFASVTSDLSLNDEDESEDPQFVTQATSDFPVKLTVYYDNKAQELSDDDDNGGSNNFTVREPKTGEILSFGVKNKLDEPVGVVLLVNGTSTLYEEEGDPSELTKWVLQPGKEFRIMGYHQKDKKTFLEIETKSDEESKRSFNDLGGPEFAGLIHLYVFRKSDSPQLASASVERFTRSIGQLPRPERKRDRTGDDTFAKLRAAIAAKSLLAPANTKGLAGMGRERDYSLDEQKLGKTYLTDTMIIRYWKNKD